MRKQLGLMAGIALSMAGVAQAAPTTFAPTENKQTVTPQAKDTNNRRKVVQSRALEVNPYTGGLDNMLFYDRGRSPKEYGQYLQSKGLQKWNKRRK